MTKIRSSFCAVLAVSFLTLGVSACERNEGPAERAGKKLDKAVENTGQQIEKAGQKIQDVAKDANK